LTDNPQLLILRAGAGEIIIWLPDQLVQACLSGSAVCYRRALAALSQARDREKKPVTINFAGQGQRRVQIGYVIETPIWKNKLQADPE
jgi:hypothetical protein